MPRNPAKEGQKPLKSISTAKKSIVSRIQTFLSSRLNATVPDAEVGYAYLKNQPRSLNANTGPTPENVHHEELLNQGSSGVDVTSGEHAANKVRKGKGKRKEADPTARILERFGVQIIHDPGADATADIVCIHGLNGDSVGSWTTSTESGNFFWPRDCLRKHIPGARILTYGYDGTTLGIRQLSHQSIPDIGEDLLVKLSLFRERPPAQRRPVIFIAHSVGGIVLKCTLVNSSIANRYHNHRHRFLHKSTLGIVFMGTPHQGTEDASWQKMLPSIYSAFTNTNVRELEDLGRDSAFLQNLSNQYTAIGWDFQTTYVYENNASRLVGGDWSVLVPKASAVVPGHRNAKFISRHTDHLGLARFSSEEDVELLDLLTILKLMLKGNLLAKPQPQWSGSSSNDSLQQSISTSEMLPVSTANSPAEISNRFGQDGPTIPSPCRLMSNCTLYTWYLLQKKLGYPLWYPSPCADAPAIYRQFGVQIGDLGCIVNGTFDYYFNVCETADHPVNLGRTPAGFTPLMVSGPDIRYQPDQHTKGTQLLSHEQLWCQMCISDGQTNVHQLTEDGFHYKTTGSEGALLVLPDGANASELRTLKKMERYAREHSRAWFDYMDEREIPAQHLCLVTGYDKTSSWGLASFRSSMNNCTSDFRFSSSRLLNTSRGTEGATYNWNCSHPVIARASHDNIEENQTVFLRGFNLSRPRERIALQEISVDVALLDGTGEEGYYRDLVFDDTQPGPSNTNTTTTNWVSSASTRFNESLENTGKPGISSLSLQTEVLHPGHSLNDYLIERAGPDVEIVISHDNDWCNFVSPTLCALLTLPARDVVADDDEMFVGLDITIKQNIAELRRVAPPASRSSIYRGSGPLPSAHIIQHPFSPVVDPEPDSPLPQMLASNLATHKREHRGIVHMIHDPGSGAIVDIVLISGPGRAVDSWTAEGADGEFFWPRDLLPAQLPEARILVYDYDSMANGFCQRPQEFISNISEDLVTRLTLFRQGPPATHRPLIFIAHSIGGVILKQALIRSFMTKAHHMQEYRYLHELTRGIVYLGTPHQGPQDVSWSQIMSAIRSAGHDSGAYGRAYPYQYWAFLQTLHSQYVLIAWNHFTLFIYETRPSWVFDSQWSMIVPRGSAVVLSDRNAYAFGRYTDHFGLAKFTSAVDNDFAFMALFLEMTLKTPVHAIKRLDKIMDTSSPNQSRQTSRVHKALEKGLTSSQTQKMASLPAHSVGLRSQGTTDVWNRYQTLVTQMRQAQAIDDLPFNDLGPQLWNPPTMGFIPTDSDPFLEMHLPPSDEMPAQRKARQKREQDAQRVSDKIDEELHRHSAQLQKEKDFVKVMLLGQAESGKSTTLKNFRMQYARAEWDRERVGWRAVVFLNIVKSILAVVTIVEEELNVGSQDTHDSDSDREVDDLPPPTEAAQFSKEHKRLITRLGALRSVEETLMQRLRISPDSRKDPVDRNPNLVTCESVRSWNEVIDPQRVAEKAAELDASTATIANFRDDMMALWNDHAVQVTLNSKRLRISDSTDFFLDQLDRFCRHDYEVLDDDILRARLRTRGIQEYRLQVTQNSWDAALTTGRVWEWRIFDVGGCRTDRAAWIPFFPTLNAIIFLCPVSCFDERLEEDPSVNRLKDSMDIWKSLCRSKLLGKTQFILFLNKCDLLKRKLKRGIQVKKHVTSYTGTNDVQSVVQYVRKKFIELVRKYSPEPRECYAYSTTATNIQSTAKTLESVRDGILQENLEGSHLI